MRTLGGIVTEIRLEQFLNASSPIVVTPGGMAIEVRLEQVEYLAPVVVIPGENEMKSLAYNALGALRGDLPVLTYTGVSCVEEMNLVVNDED